MEKESPILESLTVLESEVRDLLARLEPVTTSAPTAASPAGSTAPVEPSRSHVNTRMTTLIRELRDVKTRLEV
ncbi:MAG: hypothetical protein ABW208_10165 [Pyrinomonadaceae bacterium]